jgi:hypothetical protein
LAKNYIKNQINNTLIIILFSKMSKIKNQITEYNKLFCIGVLPRIEGRYLSNNTSQRYNEISFNSERENSIDDK